MDASGGAFGNGAGVGGSVSTSASAGVTDTLTIKNTYTNGYSLSGNNVDGIDHDNDVIYLWCNPTEAVVKSWQEMRHTDDLSEPGPVVAGTTAYRWTLTAPGNGLNIMFLLASQLKNPASVPATTMNQLALYGITAADFPAILNADPIATGTSAATNPRYVLTGRYPYEPLTNTQGVPKMPFSASSDTAYDNATDVGVGVSLSVYAKLKAGSPFFSVDLKISDTMKFDYKQSVDKSSGFNSMSSGSAGVPSSAYTGPTQVAVYYDLLFHTYAFEYYTPNAAAVVAGIVKGQQGPLPSVPVTLTIGNKKYNTATDGKGKYAFYDVPTGPATVAVANIVKDVSVGQPNALNIVHQVH